MLLKLNCPGCGKLLKAPQALAGKVIKCPHCGMRSQLPKHADNGSLESDQSEAVADPQVESEYQFDDGSDFSLEDEAYQLEDTPTTPAVPDFFETKERVHYKSKPSIADLVKENKVVLLVGAMGGVIAILLVFVIYLLVSSNGGDVTSQSDAVELGGSGASVPDKEVRTFKNFPKVAQAFLTKGLRLDASGKGGPAYLTPQQCNGIDFCVLRFETTQSEIELLKNAKLYVDGCVLKPTLFGKVSHGHPSFGPKNASRGVYYHASGFSGSADFIVFALIEKGSGKGVVKIEGRSDIGPSAEISWQNVAKPVVKKKTAPKVEPIPSHVQLPKVKTAFYTDHLCSIDGNYKVTARNLESGRYRYLVVRFEEPFNGFSNFREIFAEYRVGGKVHNNGLSYIGHVSNALFIQQPMPIRNIGFEIHFKTDRNHVEAVVYKIDRRVEGSISLCGVLEDKRRLKGEDLKIEKLSAPTLRESRLEGDRVKTFWHEGAPVAQVNLPPESSLVPDLKNNHIFYCDVNLTKPLAVTENGLVVGYYKSDKSIKVFSSTAKEYIAKILLPTQEFLPMVSEEEIIIYIPTHKKFFVYDIQTGKKKRTFSSELGTDIKIMSLIPDESGLALFLINIDNNTCVNYFDTFKGEFKGKPVALDNLQGASSSHVGKSGELFFGPSSSKIIYKRGTSSSYYELDVNDEGMWEARYISPSMKYPRILSDGRLLDMKGRVVSQDSKGEYVSFQLLEDAIVNPVIGYGLILCINKKNDSITLNQLDNGEELVSLGTMPWSGTFKGTSQYPVGEYFDLRFSYNGITGDLLLTHHEGRYISVGNYPLSEVMKKCKRPYLINKNTKIPDAVMGARWSYEIEALSSTGDYKVLGIDLPKGMKVDGKRLLWEVPSRAPSKVIVKIQLENGSAATTRDLVIRPIKGSGKGVASRERQFKDVLVPHVFVDLGHEVYGALPIAHKNMVVLDLSINDELIGYDYLNNRKLWAIKKSNMKDRYAAGGEVLALYRNESDKFYIYDLKTGELKRQFESPLEGVVGSVVMGARDDTEIGALAYNSGQNDFDIIDCKTGKRKGYSCEENYSFLESALRLVAGDNLDTITAFDIHTSLPPVLVMKRTNKRYSLLEDLEYTSDNITLPGADGYLYAEGGVYTENLKLLHSNKSKELQGRSMREYSFPVRPILDSDLVLAAEYKGEGLEASLYNKGSSEAYLKIGSVSIEGGRDYVTRGSQWLTLIERVFLDGRHSIGYLIPKGVKGIVVFNTRDAKSKSVKAVLPPLIQVVPGEKWEHELKWLGSGKKLAVSLKNAPNGMRIIGGKKITWEVPDNFSGSKRVMLQVGVDGKITTQEIALVPIIRELTKKGSWNLQATDSLMLGDGKAIFDCAPGARFAVIGLGSTLYLVEADTMKPVKQLDLGGHIDQVKTRGSEIIAVANGKLWVLKSAGLKVVKTIDLPSGDINDLSISHEKRLSFVACRQYGVEEQTLRNRIVRVNEHQNSATMLKDVYGTYVAVSPDAKILYTGIDETYHGSLDFLSNFGRLYRFSRTVDFNVLLRYQLRGKTAQIVDMAGQPGLAMTSICTDPKGEFVAVTSEGGYISTLAKDMVGIPVFSSKDLTKLKACLSVGDRSIFIEFHPQLDVCLASSGENLYLFDVISGKRRGHDLLKQNGFINCEFARFTRDWSKVWIAGHHKHYGYIMKLIDIGLSAQEVKSLKNNSKPSSAQDVVDRDLAKVDIDGAFNKRSDFKLKKADIHALLRPGVKPLAPKGIAEKYSDCVVLVKGESGFGTGFLISKGGYVLTCAHVITDLHEEVQIQINYDDKAKTYKAEILAKDDYHDLALLKVNSSAKFSYIPFSKDKKVKMGEKVCVIGNPGLGASVLTHTMTEGIVSNPRRNIEGREFLQTNAAINPGNSGGPVFNEKGNVIGVITLKGGIEAVGFAVPLEAIDAFLNKCAK